MIIGISGKIGHEKLFYDIYNKWILQNLTFIEDK